jgi:hypothetical protein
MFLLLLLSDASITVICPAACGTNGKDRVAAGVTI